MNDLWKSLVWDPLVTAALADFYVAAPLLIPLRWLINPIAKILLDKLYSLFRIFINVDLVIPLRNAEHQRAYELASLELLALEKTQGSDSPAYQKALDENVKTLSNFIAFRT